MGGFAWVTLATNDSYSLGALVLAHSLKQTGTKQQLAVLVTPGVTSAMREQLATVFNVVQEVNVLDSRDETNLRLLKRPELGITFTKLHCWRLTQFDKCVFLDADTLVLQNCDELFERDELSAAPDVGWPDCFNSGVFVYRPSNETYEKLITFALERGSFDGGDQGLLNLYFTDWAHKDISKHLPFIYNMCSTACYSYLPAFKQFGGNAKIIHFIGETKPWLQYFNTETKKVQPSGDATHLTEVLQRWWDIFCSLIHPQLTPQMTRSGPDNVHIYGSPYIVPENYPHYPSHHHEHHPESFYQPNPADDYQNVWDPWDEYDFRQSQSQIVSHSNENQPFESLNTNAYSDAGHHEHSHQYHHDENAPPTPYIHNSQPQICVQQPTEQFHDNQPEQHSFVHSHHHEVPHNYSFVQSQHTETPHSHSFVHSQHHESPHDHSFIHSQHHEITHNHSQSEVHYVPPSSHSENVHQEWNEPSFHQTPPESCSYQPPPEEHSRQAPTKHHHLDIPQHSHDVIENVTQPFHQQSHEPSMDITPHTGPPQPKTPEYHTPHPQNDPNSSKPILPIECEATSTVSNDISLHNSTIEDSSKDIEDAGLAGAFAQLTLGVARTAEQVALDDILRRQAWELGNVDYLGKDSFENIWSKIEQTLSLAPEPVVPVEAEPAAELPKEPTTTPTASEVKTPQAPAEATPEVTQETPTPPEEPKPESEPQTRSISTVAIPSSPLKESLEPAVESTKTKPLPPIALPPPESPLITPETPKELPATHSQVVAQETEVPKVPVVPESTVPTSKAVVPEPTVPTPETVVLEPAVPTPEAVVPDAAASTLEAVATETAISTHEAVVPEPPVSTPETAKDAPVVPPQATPKDVTALEEPLKEPVVPQQKEIAPPQAEVPVVEPQSVLSAPVSPVVDTQKQVEGVPPVSTPATEPVAVEPVPIKPVPVATKPVEVVTEPTKTEPVASKTEETKAAAVETEKITPEVISCPKPSPKSKTEAVVPTPTESIKSPKEGAKVKKAAKEPTTESAKAQSSPAAPKVTEATPPTSPPVQPQLKQAKEALAVDTSVPDTPPPAPSEGAAATPVPPPRKGTGGPKKPSSKTKK